MLVIRWADQSGLQRFDKALKALGDKKMQRVMQRALGRAGNMAKTQVTKALTTQTGLKKKTIVKAIKVTRPHPGNMSYVMRSFGGDISLKYFAPSETHKGVSAKPFGKSTVFAGTFLKGGRFPNRVSLNMGNHAFERTGVRREITKGANKGRVREVIKIKDSGVIIPAEMVKGATAAAFQSTVARVLPQRIAHEIKQASKGVIS